MDGYIYVNINNMKKLIILSSVIFLMLFTGANCPESKWISLLDSNLSKWEMYLSFPHKDSYKGLAPVNDAGELLKPIGYNKNVSNVFSVVEENGEPILRISGEIYGCVYTKESFENYHLKLKVKWGSKKWVPRLNEAKDSGILYHSQGECGVDYWRSWMLSQEFQIIEESMGDYWCIANSKINIKALKENDNQPYTYSQKGKLIAFGEGTAAGNFCKAGNNNEVSGNNWNELELITYGDKSLHIVNGKVVMALSNSSYMDSTLKPLTKGRIQLQSEAAEVFFKDIMIKPITKLPSEYAGYF
jgi:hypothetical protein